MDDLLTETAGGVQGAGFYAAMVSAHFRVAADREVENSGIDPALFMEKIFSENAYAELIVAGEGVPRDTLQILGAAAARAGSRKIDVADVTAGARSFFARDKKKGLEGNVMAERMWGRIEREVLDDRQTRIFVTGAGGRESDQNAIRDLFDQRLIHRIDSHVTFPEWPKERVEVWRIDYGAAAHRQSLAELLARNLNPVSEASHNESGVESPARLF